MPGNNYMENNKIIYENVMKDKQNSKAPCTWAPLPAEGCGAAFPDPSKELSLKPRPPLPRKKISYASR